METFDLTQEAILSRLYIGTTGKAKHSRTLAEEAAEKHKADQKSVRGIVQILQSDDLKDITAAINGARIAYYHRTLSWDDNAYRLLPLAQYIDLKAELDGYKIKFDEGVNKLVNKYDELKENYSARVNDLADEIPFPTREQLRGGFQFQLVTMPLARPNDIRLKHMPKEAVEELKREVTDDMTSRLKDAQEEIIIRLIEVVTKLDSQLKKSDGRLFKSLASNIQKQVSILPALNVANDPDITRLINRVNKELGSIDIEGMRDDDKAKSETTKVTASILKDLQGYGKIVASKPVKKETKERQLVPAKKSIIKDFVGFER